MVSYVDIEGKYIFKIKGLGTFTEIIKNKVTLIGLLIILIVILIYQIRLNKRKLQRKEKRYKYNKKLLEESELCTNLQRDGEWGILLGAKFESVMFTIVIFPW